MFDRKIASCGSVQYLQAYSTHKHVKYVIIRLVVEVVFVLLFNQITFQYFIRKLDVVLAS